jgi:hypothetical protein
MVVRGPEVMRDVLLRSLLMTRSTGEPVVVYEWAGYHLAKDGHWEKSGVLKYRTLDGVRLHPFAERQTLCIPATGEVLNWARGDSQLNDVVAESKLSAVL